MIIEISYPYKDSLSNIETKNTFIETDDEAFINKLTSTNNPIEIGIILSQNENKFKTVNSQKADHTIIIEEIIANPDLRL